MRLFRYITLIVFLTTLSVIPSFAADIIVAPNPWVPTDDKLKTGTLEGGITFTNLPSDGELLIYTLSGDLVIKRELNGNLTGIEKWDGKDGYGENTASGMYLWIVRSGEKTTFGKLAVLR